MKLNLQLLDRRPDEWKLSMLGVQPRRKIDRGVGYEPVPAFKGTGTNGVVVEEKKRKSGGEGGGDEIDNLFAGVGNKRRKGVTIW
jgi:hypothetical protein